MKSARCLPTAFRGVRAPASLKPLDGVGAPACYKAKLDAFRGVRAPASLKQKRGRTRGRKSLRSRPGLTSGVPGHAWGHFPGRSRPGLIEACIAPSTGLTPVRARFPGRSRPGLIEASHGPTPGLPGRSRPGLIEASIGPARARHFPGRSRPGLIEALLAKATCLAAPGASFRGVRAPASLKHPPFQRGVGPGPLQEDDLAGGGHFPGRSRPGLIEA